MQAMTEAQVLLFRMWVESVVYLLSKVVCFSMEQKVIFSVSPP